jgi:hypothetical protein
VSPPTDSSAATGSLALADCMRPPAGVAHVFLNTSLPRQEWQESSFMGQPATARLDYASSSATTPTHILYQRYDPVARTIATLGREEFDAAGALVLREEYVGLVQAAGLAAGQSQARNYIVRTLVAPSAVPERLERVTSTYDGEQVITLPDGRLKTCRVTNVLEAVPIAGAPTRLATQTVHFAPGLGAVKTYVSPTSGDERGQTFMTELLSTSAALSYLPDAVDTPPSLETCSSLREGLDIVLSSASSGDRTNAIRRTRLADFEGMPVIAIDRLHASTTRKTETRYVDRDVGLLQFNGLDLYDANEAVAERRQRTGRPDLRATPLFGTQTYVETTVSFDRVGRPVASSASADAFTFEGHSKVTTPAGTFDTCKVRFDYEGGGSETYYHAPNFHWVRIDVAIGSVRLTREVIAR